MRRVGLPIGRRSGISLLELSVVVFIGALLALIIGTVLAGSQGLSTDIERTTRGTMTTTRLVNAIVNSLMAGAEVVSFNGTSLVYQEPVDEDSDGDYVDSAGNVEWGAGGKVGWAYEYLWVDSGTFDESAEGLDLNDDGDRADAFARGDLVLRVVDAAGAERERRVLAGNGSILQNRGGADIAPLFSMPYADSVRVAITSLVVQNHQDQKRGQRFQGQRLVTLR